MPIAASRTSGGTAADAADDVAHQDQQRVADQADLGGQRSMSPVNGTSSANSARLGIVYSTPRPR